jgi:hypothetical protein
VAQINQGAANSWHSLDSGIAACVLSTRCRELACYARLLENLVATQRSDGSWPAKAFYFGGYKRARTWGCAELTTAFCVEALARFLRGKN